MPITTQMLIPVPQDENFHTTRIDDLLEELSVNDNTDSISVSTDNMCDVLNDFSLPISTRMIAFILFYRHS